MFGEGERILRGVFAPSPLYSPQGGGVYTYGISLRCCEGGRVGKDNKGRVVKYQGGEVNKRSLPLVLIKWLCYHHDEARDDHGERKSFGAGYWSD